MLGAMTTDRPGATLILDTTLYTAEAVASDGRVRSDDGVVDLPAAAPRALGGSGLGTNPEQLFAAAYAACFRTVLAAVARRQGLELGALVVTARVSIGAAGPGFGLAVELRAELPGLPGPRAEALMTAAYHVCPYSQATRGNIGVQLRVV